MSRRNSKSKDPEVGLSLMTGAMGARPQGAL